MNKDEYLRSLRKYVGVMSSEDFDRFEDFIIDKPFTPFTEVELSVFEEKLQQRNAAWDRLSKTAVNNNAGIKAEKEGNVEEAIKIYEANIKIGYPATHSFDRLMILYRKQKKYDEELRIISAAKGIFKNKPEYLHSLEKRQQKAEELKLKL